MGDDEDQDYERLSDFLQEKGAIEILLLCHTGPIGYTDIADEIRISDGKFHELWGQALELDLIKAIFEDQKKQYINTYKGNCIVFKGTTTGIVKRYQRLRETERRFKEAEDELKNWASDTKNLRDWYNPSKGMPISPEFNKKFLEIIEEMGLDIDGFDDSTRFLSKEAKSKWLEASKNEEDDTSDFYDTEPESN